MSEVLFLGCFYRCSSACINGLISPRREVQNMLFIRFKVWPMPKPPRKITCFEESSFRFREKKRNLGRREFGSILCVKSRLLSPLPVIARAVKSPLHSPGNRHFVKPTAPRGQRAVKSALNPGYSRVKPPLCPGGLGAGVSID